LALASGDDWEVASMAVTNRSLKVSRKMIKSFNFFIFPFLRGPICKMVDVIY
jgi:hypothetical protein